MAKRFTDSDKWRKPWFRSLSLKARVAWIYLTDNCDHAGIWPAAFDLMSGDLGFSIGADDLDNWFGSRVIQVSADKYFIPGYIEFQYGELSEESKPHISVIKILLKYKIDPKNLTLSEEYPKGMETLKDKDKEKAKDKDRGSAEGGKETRWKPDLVAIYKRYPRKEGKSRGIKKLEATIKLPSDEQDAHRSLDAFIAHHKRKGTEAEFIPHFSTWASSWRDCLDPTYGQADGFAAEATPLSITEIMANERGAM